ncbi:unnamed protein product [Rotaria sp. Silwood1]|nr:unnamed protein product [Rotaria sp. Silwood1]
MTPNKSSKHSSVVITTDDQKIKKKKTILKTNDNVLKNTSKKKKQKTKKILPDEQTSQDTQTSINPMNIEQKQQNSSTDNLVILLTQGLQNNDSSLLDNVLSHQF